MSPGPAPRGRSAVGTPRIWGSVLAACVVIVVLWVVSRLVRRSAERGQAESLVIDVSAAHCQRFGFCEYEAPEFFRLQVNGKLAYRPNVPAASAQNVIRAFEVCPARAIALRRLPTVVTATAGPIPSVGSSLEAFPQPDANNPRETR